MGKVVQLYLSQGGKKERFTKNSFSIEILLAVVYVTGRCVVAKKLKLPFVIRTSFIVSALRLI